MSDAVPSRPNRTGLSILVADGSEFGRGFAQATLRRAGYGRTTALRNGAEALEALSGGARHDLLILDWDVDVIPASEVIRVAANGDGEAAVPILVTMARPTRAAVDAAMAQGIRAILAKPLSPARLRERVAVASRPAGPA